MLNKTIFDKDSILFSFSLLFLFSAFGVVAFFAALISVEVSVAQKQKDVHIQNAVKLGEDLLRKNLSRTHIEKQLKGFTLGSMDPKRAQNELKGIEPKYHLVVGNRSIERFLVNSKNIIKISLDDKAIYLTDEKTNNLSIGKIIILIGLIMSILVLFVSYIVAIKKLLPLVYLRKKLEDLGKDRVIEPLEVRGNDEISRVAKSFNQALLNMEEIRATRHFFMRNVMHEIKTPITKGRITTEMLDASHHKDRLSRVFERLEMLMKEFEYVNKITLKTQDSFEICNLKELLKNMRAMIFEEGSITSTNVNIDLEVDRETFIMVLKNLAENGIKHSTDRAVQIKKHNNNLEFISRGKVLKKDLKHYMKALEKSNSDGLGMGLYIVDNVLNFHNIELEYRYDEPFNIFFFSLQRLYVE